MARVPKSRIGNKPKEAGRGAERLATLDAQGIYANPRWDRVSSRGGRWKLQKGNLIERSGKVRHNDSMMQRQQQQLEEGKDKHFKIPRKFKTGHKTLLVATEAD